MPYLHKCTPSQTCSQHDSSLLPTPSELYSREQLDSYISRALNVPLDKSGRLSPVDDSAYVLTLDFAIKMLNIHERAECRVPVIIEGETGVGKTALVEMLSKLWNYSLVKSWTLKKGRLLEYINKRLQGRMLRLLSCMRTERLTSQSVVYSAFILPQLAYKNHKQHYKTLLSAECTFCVCFTFPCLPICASALITCNHVKLLLC